MRVILITNIFFFILLMQINSQTTTIQGKPITDIYTDFHYSLNDTSKTTGFGINRAYLGYNFLPGNNFSGTIIINAGNPEDLSDDETRRRYAYFREASITYTKENFNISFGIVNTKFWDFQQKFWGKRFVSATFQSLNGYGNVADLGFLAEYKFNDIVRADFGIMNGEGYCDIQIDNSVKTSASVLVTPNDKLTFRLYGDNSSPHGITQNTLLFFAGFKNELVTIGGELNYKSNLDLTKGHDAWGFSGTCGVNVNKKTELFIRYDNSSSSKMAGDILKWNYKKDGELTIAGIQYTFNQYFKMALNYQGSNPYNPTKQRYDAIFLNANFKY
jgi:hypothetical protein